MGEEEIVKDGIVRRSVSISKEMDTWLKGHPSINSSSVFRRAINEIMTGEVIQVTTQGLHFFMIISSCVLLLLFIIVPRQYMLILILAVMLTVSIILVDSVVLYTKYQKEMYRWKKIDLEIDQEDRKLLKLNH